MRTIFEKVMAGVSNGSMTIREAAIEVHKAGWTNFIDEAYVVKLLSDILLTKH